MDCADAKLRMEPCASGALVPEELALFEEHIATCEGCRLELELVRAMGSNKSGDGKPDDWTLDRIFGSPVAKGDGTPATAPSAATEPAAETPAFPPSESEALSISPLTAGADPPVAARPAEAEPSDASMLFETTPNPLPPEQGANAPSPFGEPNTESPVQGEAPVSDSTLFDEPNPVSAMSDDALPAALTAKPKTAAVPPTPAASGADSGNSWDFEPADAKPEASLPEGSLFFAEETLARRGDARKGQSAVKRMVIWGGGALVGVALLALSIWIGLFARESGPDPKLGSPRASTGDSAPSGEAPESLSTSGEGAVDSSTAVSPEVVTQPADEVVAHPPGTTAPGASKPLGARALSGSGVPSLSTPPRSGSQQVAPRSMSGAPAATSAKGDPKKPSVGTGAASKPAATSSGTSQRPTGDAAPPAPGSRVVIVEELDPEQIELRAPPPTPTPSERSIPFGTGSKGGDGGEGAATRKPVSPPASATTAPADPGPAAPVADAVQRPIDRLHLATVAAEQESDLVTLRKVRDTWKGFVRTSVGPDRAVAKRELADCLWAIQSLTGRTSDKKAALAAFREYLLNAPAGGADPRTVARMRQLEDALAESK